MPGDGPAGHDVDERAYSGWVANPLTLSYTVDDLEWLRVQLGVAHLELDPWGSLIVSPATDEHETAVAVLASQLDRQLGLPPGCVRVNGLAWKVPGGSGYVNIPDIAVVTPHWRRTGDLHLEPPPLLVVEVASPSTRGADRGRKLTDYRLGGAGLYVLVDLPTVAQEPPIFTAYELEAGQVATASGVIDVEVDGRALRLELVPDL
jgi:Uma2 family endonuclease